jgi:hypothetical protein
MIASARTAAGRSRELGGEFGGSEALVAPVVPAEPGAPGEQLDVWAGTDLLNKIDEYVRFGAVMAARFPGRHY